MNIEYPSPKQEYKVLVRCFTFNQSRYIEDALNGFALQKTNFPFVCLVMDDASTDGEQAVIKAWMERECDMSRTEAIDIPTSVVFIVPHKTNSSCLFAFYFLKQNLFKAYEEKMKHVYPWRMKCEYEAICEGDDYWIDSSKLQKQVDYLEEHKDIGMCYTSVMQYDQEKRQFICNNWGGPYVTFQEFMRNNTVPTLSALFRTELEIKYLNEVSPYSQTWPLGDYPRWIYFSRNSNIAFINDVTGVYRILKNSAYHGNYDHMVNFTKGSNEMLYFFAVKYGYDVNIILDRKNRSLFTLATRYRKHNDAAVYFSQIRKKTIKDYIKRYFYFILKKTN